MTDKTELDALVEYLRGKGFISQREADAITTLRTALTAANARADAAEAALDKAAALIEERHVVHMTAKGRNPKDYISDWSLIAKEVRTTLAGIKGESHDVN